MRSPSSLQLEKSPHSNQDPAQPKQRSNHISHHLNLPHLFLRGPCKCSVPLPQILWLNLPETHASSILPLEEISIHPLKTTLSIMKTLKFSLVKLYHWYWQSNLSKTLPESLFYNNKYIHTHTLQNFENTEKFNYFNPYHLKRFSDFYIYIICKVNKKCLILFSKWEKH